MNEIEILTKGSPDEKNELLMNLIGTELTSSLFETIANLIADEDKGIRNSATMLMLSNPNPELPEYIVKFIASDDISMRNLAGEILIKLGSLSVATLIQFDHKNNDDIIKFIVDILGLIREPEASLYIMSILSSSENDNVILACIEAFGNIRYEGALDILMLFYDRNELFKPTIVEALGKIGSKAALEFLVSRYSNEDELTQYSILESLGLIGDIETYFFLLEQVIDISGTLVFPLITSIAILRERFNLDIPFDNRMKNLLIYTITEGTPEHKKSAFSLIDSFDEKEILLASLNLLGENNELDDMIRRKIFKNAEYLYREIGKIINSNPQNLSQILNLFLSTINYVRDFQISVNTSMLDIKNMIHAVSGLLSHHEEEVRKCAMEILFNIDAQSAMMFIDTMLNDENIWNRLRLLEILEGLEGDEYDSAYQKLALDPDEMVQERAQYLVNLKFNQQSINPN